MSLTTAMCVCMEGTDMPVMTNDPPYPQMMAIEDYWEKVGGANMLPGTVKSPDRFVRGTFLQIMWSVPATAVSV